jgi:hypothetical protein
MKRVAEKLHLLLYSLEIFFDRLFPSRETSYYKGLYVKGLSGTK